MPSRSQSARRRSRRRSAAARQPAVAASGSSSSGVPREPRVALTNIRREAAASGSGPESAEERRIRKYIRKQKLNGAADFFAMCDPRFKIQPPPAVPLALAQEMNLFETQTPEGRRAYKRYVHHHKGSLLMFLEMIAPEFRGDVNIYDWIERLTAEQWGFFRLACSRMVPPTAQQMADPRKFMDDSPSRAQDESDFSTDGSDSDSDAESTPNSEPQPSTSAASS